MHLFLDTLTILAFLMTSITWIIGAISRSIRIDFDVLDHRTYTSSCKIYVRLTNKSLVPITIYSISLVENGCEHFCFLQPKLSRQVENLLYYTAEFPINLVAHQGGQYYVEYCNFPNDEPIQLIEGKTVAFRIYTSRSVITRSVTLGKPDYYLRIRQ